MLFDAKTYTDDVYLLNLLLYNESRSKNDRKVF